MQFTYTVSWIVTEPSFEWPLNTTDTTGDKQNVLTASLIGLSLLPLAGTFSVQGYYFAGY